MKRPIAILLVLLGAATLVHGMGAADESLSEYEIKAAFLYNFAKFADWPESAFSKPAAPLVIGILGKDPFGPILDQVVEKKPIDGRPVFVKRLKNAREAKGVHILFVPRTDNAELGRAFKEIDPLAILIVGENEKFAERYGTIGFFIEENRVRFEINVASAERAGIKLNAKLLQLARIVGNGKGDGK